MNPKDLSSSGSKAAIFSFGKGPRDGALFLGNPSDGCFGLMISTSKAVEL
jgi:hypothetical protein